MKALPNWKLKKLYKCDVLLSKVAETEIGDSEFGQVEETETTYSIKAEIQPITLEDMVFLPAGRISVGDAWGFFLPSYKVEGIEVSVEVNDYITFKDLKYLVVSIEDQYHGNEVIYRRAMLRREVGQ